MKAAQSVCVFVMCELCFLSGKQTFVREEWHMRRHTLYYGAVHIRLSGTSIILRGNAIQFQWVRLGWRIERKAFGDYEICNISDTVSVVKMFYLPSRRHGDLAGLPS